LLKQYPDKEMEAYPVSTAVNMPKNDSAELIKSLKGN
jgi:putative SOS response-associated peptidase YedK